MRADMGSSHWSSLEILHMEVLKSHWAVLGSVKSFVIFQKAFATFQPTLDNCLQFTSFGLTLDLQSIGQFREYPLPT